MEENETCIFCRIRNGEEPTNLLLEDSKCFVILDVFPSAKGHMLVVAKKHYSSLLATPNPLSGHMLVIARRFAEKAKSKLNATGIKIVINIGRDAGQLVDHFHIHLLPFYHSTPDEKSQHRMITKQEAEKLVKLLTEVNNAHAFQNRNLGT